MPDDKRNRPEQPQSGNQGPDRDRKDRKPGGTESPGSGRARREDEEEPQE